MLNTTIKLILILLFLFITSSSAETQRSLKEDDSLEGLNRATLSFNLFLDTIIIRPISYGYNFITPNFVIKGVDNVFANLDEIPSLFNHIFQLEFKNSYTTLGRFSLNSSIGVLGLFDVASAAEIKREKNDFGKTLFYYGFSEGSYVVIPLLGPSTLRGFIGRFFDFNFNPISYSKYSTGLTAVKIISIRRGFLDSDSFLDTGVSDEYIFIKKTYYEKRKKDLGIEEEDSFDVFFEFD